MLIWLIQITKEDVKEGAGMQPPFKLGNNSEGKINRKLSENLRQ